ncbi:MAG: helix-turn-helix transcriptional regulator [Polyangiaceae bacterium]|nr:helix-turn-helix transcriptional regulator [Polyangiaceae bacterium]
MLYMTENSGIAERLRQAMAVRGFSVTELGKSSGVDKSHVTRLLKGERGEGMRPPTRKKLAVALDVTAEWLFAGVGPNPFGAPDPSPQDTATSVMIAERIASNVKRYPSKAGAAVALRAMGVSEEAIEAMLTEENTGNEEVDPGRKHWIDQGLWWEAEIRRGKATIESDAFTEAAPMEGRKTKRSR